MAVHIVELGKRIMTLRHLMALLLKAIPRKVIRAGVIHLMGRPRSRRRPMDPRQIMVFKVEMMANAVMVRIAGEPGRV